KDLPPMPLSETRTMARQADCQGPLGAPSQNYRMYGRRRAPRQRPKSVPTGSLDAGRATGHTYQEIGVRRSRRMWLPLEVRTVGIAGGGYHREPAPRSRANALRIARIHPG